MKLKIKKMKSAALFIIGGFGFLNCSAMKADTVVVIVFSSVKQKATITVHKGDTLLVKFPMASGTGFVWELSGQPMLCKQGDTQYENIKSSVPGSSIREVMSFDITATGAEEINFVYHRPFEKNKPPAKIKTLRLVVQ